ncbi:MAG TPA: glycosyltransferase family 39 protein [Planctomycetota bacterium]
MSARRAWALAILLAVAAGVRIRWFTGLQMGDDIVYSRITVDRLSGTTSYHNVHQTRSGFLLGLLGSAAAFGPGEVPLVLYNLLCSLGLVAALSVLGGRLFGDAAGLAAGAIAALHPNLVRFASECHTDTPAALWLTLALAALRAATSSDRSGPLRLLSGLLMGWAYLHKEHAVFVIPFVLGHWIAGGRRWTWYLPTGLAFAGVFAAELAGFAILTDNPFKRYEMVRYWHAGQYMAEQYPTSGALLYRVFLDLPAKLLAPWNGLIFPAGLIALWAVRRDVRARWIAGWFLALYLGYSAWPSSLVPFRPGFTLYQWTLPVLWPPLILLLAAGLARLRPRVAVAILLLLSLVHLGAIHAAWVHDRRFSDGPREARAWLEGKPYARIFADDKMIEAFDFWDGHDPSRRYFRFQDPEAPSRGVVIVDRFRTEPGHWWSRPGVTPDPRWKTLYESGRLRIYDPLNVDSLPARP